MNLAHIEQAVRAKRIGVGDAADETLAEAILNHEAMARRIIAPGSRSEQRVRLVEFFQEVARQATP